jgi:hypothetical protein
VLKRSKVQCRMEVGCTMGVEVGEVEWGSSGKEAFPNRKRSACRNHCFSKQMCRERRPNTAVSPETEKK